MSKAKLGKYNKLYERLRIKEWKKEACKVAKGREKQCRDFKNIRCIKMRHRKVFEKYKSDK